MDLGRWTEWLHGLLLSVCVRAQPIDNAAIKLIRLVWELALRGMRLRARPTCVTMASPGCKALLFFFLLRAAVALPLFRVHGRVRECGRMLLDHRSAMRWRAAVSGDRFRAASASREIYIPGAEDR